MERAQYTHSESILGVDLLIVFAGEHVTEGPQAVLVRLDLSVGEMTCRGVEEERKGGDGKRSKAEGRGEYLG